MSFGEVHIALSGDAVVNHSIVLVSRSCIDLSTPKAEKAAAKAAAKRAAREREKAAVEAAAAAMAQAQIGDIETQKKKKSKKKKQDAEGGERGNAVAPPLFGVVKRKHKKKKPTQPADERSYTGAYDDHSARVQQQNSGLVRKVHLQPYRTGPLGSPQDDLVDSSGASAAERPQYEGLVVIGGDDSPTYGFASLSSACGCGAFFKIEVESFV